MSKELALAAKTRGNDAFTKGDFPRAIEEFTEAIKQDPTDAVFFSNRSGAYASLKQFDQALEDANQCVALKPSFVKGYSRQGVALFGLNKLSEAKSVYEAGLKVDPKAAALLEGLQDVEQAEQRAKQPKSPQGGAGAGADAGLGSMFGPEMWPKLNANPTTREYMKDPSFVAKLQSMQSNPGNFSAMLSDPRLSKALGVILGVDLAAMGPNGMSMSGAGADTSASSSMPNMSNNGGAHVEDEDEDDEDADMVQDEKPAGGRKFKQTGEMTPEEAKAAREATFKKPAEPVKELTEEEKAELAAKEAADKAAAEEKKAAAKIRAEADKEKNIGNDLYKKRDFPGAIAHYESAIKIDPTNIVYYNNLAAVYMETKEYTLAIDTAVKGAAIGKERLANYTDVAKAYSRIGAAYQAQGKLTEAIEYYNKSLLEDYNDKTKTALKKIEEEKKKAEQAAYIDPVKSEEHKAKGNELFGAGKYVEAIGEYTESIKRDPKNYKVYSNRAACYSKMMDWQRGLNDCETCLSMDPKFVKAYLRKGKIQHFLKQYHKALTTYDQALEIEPGNAEVMEAKRATMIAIQTTESDPERAKEAMKDPEIQQILRDPTISKVLQDMQSSPQAGQAAMRDPEIRKKIEKLIAAGVLGVK